MAPDTNITAEAKLALWDRVKNALLDVKKEDDADENAQRIAVLTKEIENL